MKIYYKPEEILVLYRYKKDYFIYEINYNDVFKFSKSSYGLKFGITYGYKVYCLDLL